MAITTAVVGESANGNQRYKIYKVTHDGSDTGMDITPGTGFTIPVGSYTSFSESSGVYTFLVAAGTNLELSYITFYSGI